MAGKKYPAVTAGEQYRIGRASVLGWQKKAFAISIIGGADGPTSIFIAGKVNSGPVYMLTALLILATVVTALVIRKQHKDKTDRPQK